MKIVILAISITAFVSVLGLFWRKICSSSLSPRESMIEDLLQAGYVEVKWKGTKLFLKTFKRHGYSLFIMDGDPKRFRALYYDAEGTLLNETHHDIIPDHTAADYRDEGTPVEDDGIIR